MYSYFNTRFNKHLYDISPGEYMATGDDVILSTVLGSCVSVIIHDRNRKMGGLNHFMLVEGRGMEKLGEVLRYERYGTYAMETLLNEFIRTGSFKKDLQAKVFGGGKILDTGPEPSVDIGFQNIQFAVSFLENEEIPILAQDTGGVSARRLFVYPREFRVLLKRERGKMRELAKNPPPIPKSETRIVLFDQ